MKCAIADCLYTHTHNPLGVSFHGFPTDVEVLHVWVAATGRSDFTPKYTSKICSAHFDESAYLAPKRLKPNAVPTIFPKSASLFQNKETNSEMLQVKPVTSQGCAIQLKQKTTNETVTTSGPVTRLSQTCNVVSIVSPQPGVLHTPLSGLNNTIVLNYGGNMSPAVSSACLMPIPAQFGGKPGQSKFSSVTLQPISPLNTIPNSKETIKTPLGPLKIVDVQTLLKKPTGDNVENTCSGKRNRVQYSNAEKDIVNKRKPELSNVTLNKSDNRARKLGRFVADNNTNKDFTITLSHVLNCIRVILPAKFDLSRLIPNEKVVALVIRYLRLLDNEGTRLAVKNNLKIIVDAAKAEVKYNINSNDPTHPYLNISDEQLHAALEQIFPQGNILAGKLSEEILKCLCIILNRDIYPEGFEIIRRKIRRLTPTDGGTGERINLAKDINREFATLMERTDSKVSTSAADTPVHDNRQESTEGKQRYGKKSVAFTEEDDPDSSDELDVKPRKRKLEEDKEWCAETDGGMVNKPKKQYEKKHSTKTPLKLESIVKFLEEENCTASDVLESYRLLFYLCRFMRIRSKECNLRKLKIALQLIIRKNINKDNVKQFDEKVQKIQNKKTCMSLPYAVKINDRKLKLKPVVVLRDVVEFKSDSLLFMHAGKTVSKKIGPQENRPIKKYSPEHVRQITYDSYREFRRIIVKRDGSKIVFRLKFTTLVPGLEVFVKDFSDPFEGWVKGTVSKMESPLEYTVELEGGELRRCLSDQIRPLPHCKLEASPPQQRTQRIIKPKQLFDL